jgi:hypothetical protein
MPQILETELAELIGDTYSVLADGTGGASGQSNRDLLARALAYNVEAGSCKCGKLCARNETLLISSLSEKRVYRQVG